MKHQACRKSSSSPIPSWKGWCSTQHNTIQCATIQYNTVVCLHASFLKAQFNNTSDCRRFYTIRHERHRIWIIKHAVKAWHEAWHEATRHEERNMKHETRNEAWNMEGLKLDPPHPYHKNMYAWCWKGSRSSIPSWKSWCSSLSIKMCWKNAGWSIPSNLYMTCVARKGKNG